MTAAELAQAVAGRLAAGDANASFARVCTDTRALDRGDLFVALRGDNFDGNDFVDEAVTGGAAVLLVSREPADPGSAAVVVVPSTLRALGDLAAAHRAGFRTPIVAITGSNGKTTTKELLRAILDRAYGADAVLANRGNFNNLIGMPLTLLELSPAHRVAVLEMGMNAPGEIARLAEIARPDVGVITMVGAAHLEGLGSLEGVAKAKGELFDALGPDDVAVVNTDDARVVERADRTRAKRIGFGSRGEIRAEDVRIEGFEHTRFRLLGPGGEAAIDLPLAGRHNVANATAAAACAIALGIDLETIAAGLSAAAPPPMRFAPERLANGVLVINDSYNANPSSLAASISVLGETARARTMIVLGDMLELGREADSAHIQAGRDAAGIKPVLLCAVGERAERVAEGAREAGMDEASVRVCADHGEAASEVERRWRSGDTVLVKGSRGSAMECVVEALREAAAERRNV